MDPFRRKGSRVWVIKWRDAHGKWKFENTKARTKAEAQELVAAEEMRVSRQRRGLGLLPSDCKWTLGHLREWWLKNRCPEPSRETAELQSRKHTKSIESLLLRDVTPEVLETRFDEMKANGAGPATINKVRTYLHSMFEQGKKKWPKNPAAETKPREVPKRHYELLSIPEMSAVLDVVPAHWLNFIAAGIFTAMRKGEICGAEKRFVDLPSRTILVAASHQRTTTKGKKWRTHPISSHFLPFVEAALKTPGPYLFPDEDGKQRTKHSDPHLVLRKALAKIGITRRVRLHDLRHSIATELLRRTGDLARVSRYLGHARISTTADLYGHLISEDLRPMAELFGAPVVQPLTSLPHGPSENRTPHPYRVKVESNVPDSGTSLQAVVCPDSSPTQVSTQSPTFAPNGKSSGAPVVQG